MKIEIPDPDYFHSIESPCPTVKDPSMKQAISLFFATFSLVAITGSEAAFGFTLYNNDNVSYEVEIAEGPNPEDVSIYELFAGEGIEDEDVCLSGCTLRINDGDAIMLEGDEDVEIKDGQFVIVSTRS